MSARHARTTATRQALLTAAAELMTAGNCSFSTQKVCESAGLTTGALYYHFDDKADLVAAVMREHQHSVNEAADRAHSDEAAPIESMIRFSFDLVKLLTHDPFVRASAQLSVAPARAPYATDIWNEWVAVLTHFAEAAAVAGEISSALDPDHLAEHIIAAIVGTWLTTTSNYEDFYVRIQEMWDIFIASNVQPPHRASSRSFALAVCAQIATDFP